MAFMDLREYLVALEKGNALNRITAEVDWDQEIGAIAEESLKKGRHALLFENIKDHQDTHGKKVLINTAESLPPIAIAFGFPLDMPIMEMIKTIKEKDKQFIKPRLVSTGPCKEVIEKGAQVNLWKFPTPKLHAQDGGRYLETHGGVVTRDPDTGWQNIGIYRGMIHDRNSMGLLWVATRHWGLHGMRYRELGKPMPVAITIGGGPVLSMAYFSHAARGVCEYDLAGAFAGEPIDLVKCETLDLEVPATSEIVLEGELSLDPATFKPEGPFGEFPGYYTSVWAEPRPVFQVKCVTHRRDPILESSIPGMGPVHPQPKKNIIQSAQVWNRLEDTGVPGIAGVYVEAVQPGMVYIGIQKLYYGHAKQVATALWGTGLADVGKYVIVTDSDVDITNASKVLGAMVNRTQGTKDIVICPATFGGHLDPGTHPDVKRKTGGVGSWDRVLIDATWPFEWEPREEWGGLRHPMPCQAEEPMVKKVHQRWQEYGFES